HADCGDWTAHPAGASVTSRRSDAIIAEAHQAMADMLGAASPDEIKFGPNMTTLTFHITRSIVATMAPGDEIVLTGLDHHGNVDPWLGAARDRGITVRFWEPRLEDCTLALAGLDEPPPPRPRLVPSRVASRCSRPRGPASWPWAGRRRRSGRSPPLRRSSRGPMPPAPGRTSTPSTRRRHSR